MRILREDFFKVADDRTYKEIQDKLKQKGFLFLNIGWKSITNLLAKRGLEYKIVNKFHHWINPTGEMEAIFYRYDEDENSRYIIEYPYQVGVEEYLTISLTFNYKYNNIKESMLLIHELWLLNNKIEGDTLILDFTCLVCGKDMHWLDMGMGIGECSLLDKVNHLKVGQCICCERRQHE